jgi:LacI family transcriptional regulator
VNWIRRRRWLESRLQTLPRPLALFALDDILASEVAEVCLARGWEVPGEISVLGAGNLSVACECSRIPISSVETREAEVAWKAAETLDRFMKRTQVSRDTVFSPGPVVVRASTDTVAAMHPVIRAAVRFMKENLSKPFGVDEIAGAAGVSRRALYSLFTSELNTTPASMLTGFRLERARCLLLDTDEKVAAVAVLCGFGTSRTFDRVFIKAEGSTPAAWRAAALEPVRKLHKVVPERISADGRMKLARLKFAYEAFPFRRSKRVC